MNIRTHLSFAIVLVATLIAGCANTGTTNSSGASTRDSASGSAVSGAVITEVPALKVSVDCPCQVRDGIAELIVAGYTEAATKAGQKVSTTQVANLTIKSYAARGDAARFFAGVFAGKDEIKASISHQGRTFEVEDYYVNAWLGIDALARKIGEMTHAGIK